MKKLNYQAQVYDEIPGRVFAAMCFVSMCRAITDPEPKCDVARDGRDLKPKEQSAYDAALGLCTLYFTGEIDLGGVPMCETLEAEAPGVRAAGPMDEHGAVFEWSGAD